MSLLQTLSAISPQMFKVERGGGGLAAGVVCSLALDIWPFFQGAACLVHYAFKTAPYTGVGKGGEWVPTTLLEMVPEPQQNQALMCQGLQGGGHAGGQHDTVKEGTEVGAPNAVEGMVELGR